MQRGMLFNLLCFLFGVIAASDPIEKVLDLITDLQATMTKKGEVSQKIYAEFSRFCVERRQELNHELSAENLDKKDLSAQVQEDNAVVVSNTRKKEKEAGDILKSEDDLGKITKIRKKEAADFKEEEKELMEMISMLQRAKKVLEKELSKGGASMLQQKGVSSFASAMDVMVQASLCSSEDAQRLAALVQTHQVASESDDDTNAAPPAAAAYQGSSGTIVGMIADLLKKADDQLNDLRMKEEEAAANYKLLAASLGREIQTSTEDKDTAHKRKGEASEEEAIDEGDLGVTVDDIKGTIKTLADLRRVCLSKVEEFTAMMKSRNDEIKALSEAKKVIKQAVGQDAAEQVYGAPALLQMGISTNTDSVSQLAKQVLQKIGDIAKKENSFELNQLVSRLTSTIKLSTRSGEDPFAKVIGMITDMIAKLEQEAADDADHNAYCEQEMTGTAAKKEEHSSKIEALSTKIDKMLARSAKLKKKVVKLQNELAAIAKAQAKLDKIRTEENDEYLSEKEELDKGLKGVQVALGALKNYYGKDERSHKTRVSESHAIISLLETIEGDFSKTLAGLMASEQSAVTEYETETQDNQVAKNKKTVSVEGKTKEFTSLDKAVSDSQSDKNSIQTELDAVLNYLSKLKKECVMKKDTLEEQMQKRQVEIAGLKEALNILEKETTLLQVHRSLRQRRQQFLG